ncbi:rho GTPase-activating protein 20 isoform X2 [Lepisosteus oculatus]|uniref:rho GTPase-activating protein 20 isoform X2 n=1 Tax=Lepisosteus oculatus TaxID=7918 RepID=UPI00073FC3A1|nr:PREDICTED: rho GTPase-activating protein 20-like isoform X2 [Lepisosteus oculatus]
MTPQQNNNQHLKEDHDEVRARIQEREKMKTTIQRRRSAPSAITKALSKSRTSSRDGHLLTVPSNNGSFIQAFTSQTSTFIMEEHVHLTTGLQTQERHLFLFSDILIIAKSKSSSNLKLKHQVRLSEMWIASCMDEVAERKLSLKNSFVIGWPTTNYVVTLSSSEAKEKWLSTLQWQINEMKQDEYPKKIAMKIMLLDVGNCTSTTTIDVSNKDTVEKVIMIAIQQLGFLGRPTDYHLWVISGKEEAPYPLIGHEYPFSIIMNCVRESVDQCYLANNNIITPDGTLLPEQIPKDQQCQFILKPRKAVRTHIRTDYFQKHFKRKKSLIDWALRRGNTSHSSSQGESPSTPRKLFGHSLSTICQNGNLPKPIMDMLCLLYYEGSTTKGIFRRSANAKTCKELKERLNSGGSVQVEGESVFVAAAVITDFLRNIPGSVLSTELYEKWMEVIEIEEHDDKIEAMKRLVDHLPEANVTLLRHLFGLLHHIEKKSEENQMTAFNLALCIAPNMLWLPVPAGPEEESKSTRKVASLVQLLIENSPTIFGDDIMSLFKNINKKQRESSGDTIDGDTLQQQYSSDEFDSEQERQKLLHGQERNSYFLPLNDLVLKEDKEGWGLLDAIDTYKKEVLTEDSAYSCENLDDASFHSTGSICCLGTTQSIQSARDRCSSEPSVCISSQPLTRFHAPVARQSSCDAAMTRGQTDCFQHMQKLRIESSKVSEGDCSPKLNSKSKYSLWRSPQIASRMRHFGPPRMNLSNRSSFSSLSSTATSPSASSLSSLDSAFSYCSDSVFSPSDVSSLPFLFGTSAKLQPLSPDTPSKFPKDWSMALPSSMAREPCDLKWYDEYDEKDEENNNCSSEAEEAANVQTPEEEQSSSGSLSALNINSSETDQDNNSEIDGQEMESSLSEGRNETDRASETSKTGTNIQHKELSVKHIKLVRPEGSMPNKDKLKRTKITFYMAPSKLTVKRHSDHHEKEQPSISVSVSSASGAAEDNADKTNQTLQVHIPQSVFYGQNTPLVLRSVSTRQSLNSEENDGQAKTAVTDGPVVNISTEHSPEIHPVSKTHGKAASTIRHTIRIRLPAAVRNTVKEYFHHSDPKNSHPDVKAVEKEIVRSKLEWHSKNYTASQQETVRKLMHGEESFV